MSADPGDLANLADLALPAAISFWPPAAGVWIVGAAAAAALAVAGWRALQRYRADAYLRRAAAEIDAASDATEPSIVSAVLKRAAMVAYGRERVASLTGAAWTAFIVETAPAGKPMEVLTTGLDALFSTSEHSSARNSANLSAQAKAWLRGQRGRAFERG